MMLSCRYAADRRNFSPHQKKVSQLKTSATYPQKANFELPYGHIDFPKWSNHYLTVWPQCLCPVMLDIFSSSRIKEKPSPCSRHTDHPLSAAAERLLRTAATSGKVFQSKSLNASACGRLEQLLHKTDKKGTLLCNAVVQFQFILIKSKVV